jgi:hypothetical protein
MPISNNKNTVESLLDKLARSNHDNGSGCRESKKIRQELRESFGHFGGLRTRTAKSRRARRSN